MLKIGDMVKAEMDGKTVYGIIKSVVDQVADVSFSKIGNSECKEIVLPFELDNLKKIGRP